LAQKCDRKEVSPCALKRHLCYNGRKNCRDVGERFQLNRSSAQEVQEYKNDKLVVRYDPGICIHAGECVRGLPSVFNVSKKPWIDVNGASPAGIIEQVKCCPSGALTYEVMKDAP
jgi:uncharacterized Fe-S cluster protein YjdI